MKRVWDNKVLDFSKLMPKRTRKCSRIFCGGNVSLVDERGRIVAKGQIKDINENSIGLDIEAKDLKIEDELYLEFLEPWHLILSQVKIALRRVQLNGNRLRVGAEWTNTTPAFHEKLNAFLADRKAEISSFGEFETI